MSDRPIFHDPSSRRWWWIRAVSAVLGLLSIAAVTIFVLSITRTLELPGMPGITQAIKRTLRQPVHPHSRQLQEYLLKRSRERLLSAVARDQKVKRGRRAGPAGE